VSAGRLRIPFWALALAVIALAACTRLFKLGDWPFSGDEVATLQETRAFFEPGFVAPEPQIALLPRAIPVSYYVNSAGYAWFGWSEWGSRVMPAAAGTSLVLAIVVLGRIGLGTRTALIAALLVALSPAYVQQSQTNRFYSLAALLAAIAMLAGGAAVARGGPLWIGLAAVASVTAALTHTVAAALVAFAGVGIVLATWRPQPSVAKAGLVTFVAAGAAFALLFTLRIRPLLTGWNAEVPWAYSPVHALLAAVNMLGWPTALLAGFGLVAMIQKRDPQRWYWSSLVACWATAVVLLPFVMTYHPWYAFPLALSVMVCASYGVSELYDRLQPSVTTSVAWLGVAALMGLPGLLSHFVDGSRADHRSAVEYVDRHWKQGDRVLTMSPRTFSHYAPGRSEVVELPHGDAARRVLDAEQAGRFWIVLESPRGGILPVVREWLSSHAVHRFHASGRRFDYFQFNADVFLVDAISGSAPADAPGSGRSAGRDTPPGSRLRDRRANARR
jgi:hypothetical protein